MMKVTPIFPIENAVKKRVTFDTLVASSVHCTAVLAAIAAVLHAGCFAAAIILSRANSTNPVAVYELYRPAFVVSTAAARGNLKQSCPRADLTLLTLQADFANYSVSGSWVPAKSAPFGVRLNGYNLLFLIFGVSCLAQLNVLWEYRHALAEGKYEYFETPCAARWLEYAFTSPSMVLVIAACLAIRDAQTLMLLAAAQGALVQFGFAMECAFSLRWLEDARYDAMNTPVAFNFLPIAPAFHSLPKKISYQLWYWSFVPSTVLHVLVWGILISNFAQDKCFDNQPSVPPWLVAILIGQGVFFTLFMVVAIGQAWFLGMIPCFPSKEVTHDQVKLSFRVAFACYTFLSMAAKVMLGVTYLAYVAEFPFYTPA